MLTKSGIFTGCDLIRSGDTSAVVVLISTAFLVRPVSVRQRRNDETFITVLSSFKTLAGHIIKCLFKQGSLEKSLGYSPIYLLAISFGIDVSNDIGASAVLGLSVIECFKGFTFIVKDAVFTYDGNSKMQDVNGMLVYLFCKLRTCFRSEIVISVEEESIFAAGVLDTGFASEMKSLVVWMRNRNDAWIFFCGASKNFGGGIRTGVIDNNCLEIRKCLVTETVKTLLKIFFHIVCGNDNRNFRHKFSLRYFRYLPNENLFYFLKQRINMRRLLFSISEIVEMIESCF